MENAENKNVDKVLEELMKNQFANDTKRYAMFIKNFYDSFLSVGFSVPMAEKMILAMIGNTSSQRMS